MFRTRSPLVVAAVFAVALALAAGACGKSNKVGDKSLLNFKDQTQERLGQKTTTTAAASQATTTTVAGGKAGIGNTTTTAARATTTTAQAVGLEIAINSDAATTQFEPATARVYAGTLVKWNNTDTVARTVQADNGAFVSPSIAPGQSWTYKMSAPGKFNYHDGTRPYAVASIEVVAR